MVAAGGLFSKPMFIHFRLPAHNRIVLQQLNTVKI